jgi:uncharacterized protein (DUF433 family)/DNA-binding transcriptional MerR regulator
MKEGPVTLLESGIYTIPQAAELVGADVRALRTWVEGRKDKQAPVIDNELGRIGRDVAVSFTNLMELRFVSTFAKAGVRLNEIRAIMKEVEDVLKTPHPFAKKVVFRTDGRKIFAEIARKNGVQVIYDLRSKNYEMHLVVLKSLKENVIWDPAGEAVAWFPRPEIAPNVMVHRSYSFGRPVLKNSHVPTSAIADAYRAEKSVRKVAWMFEVPEKQVKEAIGFDDHLRKAA